MVTRLLVLFGIWVLSLTPHAQEVDPGWANTNWVWTAPEPALEGTRHWDFGWDSTSNSFTPPVIEGELAARTVDGKVHATGRWLAKGRALPHPPPLPPPAPPRTRPPQARPIIIVFRLF